VPSVYCLCIKIRDRDMALLLTVGDRRLVASNVHVALTRKHTYCTPSARASILLLASHRVFSFHT
jgi:hypothetical protein